MSKIYCDTIEEMIEICANLVREGIVFEGKMNGNGWVIEMNGGH